MVVHNLFDKMLTESVQQIVAESGLDNVEFNHLQKKLNPAHSVLQLCATGCWDNIFRVVCFGAIVGYRLFFEGCHLLFLLNANQCYVG